ncbi:hypothetical protein ONZ45_g748 [Pleurotus djamor]|nr:hypothetical protein ONZ45_g748 [Pleurotus djamor]
MRLMTRIPILRGLIPRLSTPILPVASRLYPMQSSSNRLFTRFPARLTSRSPSPPPSPQLHPSLPPDASMSQRLKHLIKSYGWYALGVYLILSALDFGVAFVGIQLIGAEHVSRVATAAKEFIAQTLHSSPPEPGRDELDHLGDVPKAPGQEGFYAMLVLAYTVHKTLFLPVRVGLTAACTPRIVGWLRQRGWAGSAGTRRAAAEMRERIRSNRKNRDED